MILKRRAKTTNKTTTGRGTHRLPGEDTRAFRPRYPDGRAICEYCGFEVQYNSANDPRESWELIQGGRIPYKCRARGYGTAFGVRYRGHSPFPEPRQVSFGWLAAMLALMAVGGAFLLIGQLFP